MKRLVKYWSTHGEWLLHGLFWLWYFSAVNVHWLEDWTDPSLRENTPSQAAVLAFPLLFYAHAFWLIPAFLRKRKVGAYLLFLGVLLLGLEALRCLSFALWRGVPAEALWPAVRREFLGSENLLTGAAPLALVVSALYRFSKDWILHRRLIDRLRAERLDMELSFLKSQIDPHFLFNSLNSLYSLALEEDSPQTAESITRLAGMMRYNLHDAQADLIELDRELEFIRQYAAMQQLRTTEKNEVRLQVEVEEPERWRLPPLLLIPFVENAFKFGLHPNRASFVHLCFRRENDRLHFSARNSLPPGIASRKGGIGLANLRQRLELLCPGAYDLTFGKKGDTFEVSLNLKLQT